MARKSRRQASRSTPTLPSAGRRAVGSLLAGALIGLASSQAGANLEPTGDSPEPSANPELRPYTAQYDTSALGMTVTLTRELKTDGDGGYTLTNGGKILVVGFHEVAVFSIDDGEIVPKSYVYQGTGLINRRREIHFTPGSDTVRSLYKGEWYDLPNEEGTLDRFSQQEHLRLMMLNDPNPRNDLEVTIADGRKVKHYKIEYRGDEVLDTPLGAINTLHFERVHDDPERKSHFWVAPAWDYLMVKTTHIEDDKPVEVVLTSASIDGVPVTADVADEAGV